MSHYLLMDGFLLIVIGAMLYKVKLCKPTVFNDAYLSKGQTDTLKGMLAFGVYFNHFSGWFFTMSPAYYVLNHIGSYLVSVFFFLSGYGLFYGYLNKNNYLKSFPAKRFLTLVLPYWFCILVYSAWHLYNKSLTLPDFLKAFIGQSEVVKNSWFVLAMFVMYVSFFFAGLISGKVLKNKKYTIALFTLLQTASLIYRFDWIASIFNMSLGMLWYKYQDKIDRIVNKRYWVLMLLNILLLCMASFPKYLFASQSNTFLMNLSDAVSGMLFTVLIINLLKKIRLTNIVSALAGKMSYEIYLLHGLGIEIAFSIAGRDNPLIFGLLSLSLSIVFSVAVNFITKKIKWRETYLNTYIILSL